jgi:hypothetical protein
MSKPHILMLVDRLPIEPFFGFSYAEPDTSDLYYFSISQLLSVLNADITKAHRQTDPFSDSGAKSPADIENFRFSDQTLAGVDEVWLIGYNSIRPDLSNPTKPERESVLGPKELAALSRFMESGGGVFAAGDHAGLGVSLAGSLPRVRSMRLWWYPTVGPLGEPIAPEPTNMGNRSRLDTTQSNVGDTSRPDPDNPGKFLQLPSSSVWFDNQSDDIPQYLSPLHTTNMCYDPSVYPLNPSLLHPLLQGPNGPILAFADHMHEGEVVLPDVMPNGYGSVFHFENQEFVEYPSGANGQVKPQIIAWSYTNGCASIVTPRQQLGGVHFGDSEISPYQMFGAIGVYDGSILGKGRIVVESTFHHFVDLNLQGDPVAPVGDPRNLGFKGSDSGGQSILANIEQYYNNVVNWLAPPHFALRRLTQAVTSALLMQPLRDIAHNAPADRAQWLGQIMIDAVQPSISFGMLSSSLRSILPSEVITELPAQPWGPVTGTTGCGGSDETSFVHTALGGAILAVAELRRHTHDGPVAIDDRIERAVKTGALDALASFSDQVESQASALSRLARALGSLRARERNA